MTAEAQHRGILGKGGDKIVLCLDCGGYMTAGMCENSQNSVPKSKRVIICKYCNLKKRVRRSFILPFRTF